jgi:single-stranded-DNA-specific exonuclease
MPLPLMKWKLPPDLLPAQDDDLLVQQILRTRGYEEASQQEAFLAAPSLADGNGAVSELLGDPYTLSGMQGAVERIHNAIREHERICIYGDFDADGVTSTALMVQVLTDLGAHVIWYIPDRVDEGYGLHLASIEALAAAGIELLITVDCGIRALDEIATGMARGMDVIVTDHHRPGDELPDACAVINPRLDEAWRDKALAGVGVAFLLAIALLGRASPERRNGFRLRDLIDLVAIGTVADMVSLRTPANRVLVRDGLRQIQESPRAGLGALLRVAKVAPDQVTSATIGYVIGPRLNAAGRLEHADKAVRLLLAHDTQVADWLAGELDRINRERQAMTADALELVVDQAAPGAVDNLIFATDRDFHQGVIGLVAGNLVRRFYRPAVVLQVGEDESHASCRSIPEFDITAALDACADLLVRHGGHAAAAGFTVLNDNIQALQQCIEKQAADSLAAIGEDLMPSVQLDAVMNLKTISPQLLAQLQALEPTGQEWPQPVFLARDVEIAGLHWMGRDQQHVRLRLRQAVDHEVEAVWFGAAEFRESLMVGKRIDVVFALEANHYNGRVTPQMKIQDVRLCD